MYDYRSSVRFIICAASSIFIEWFDVRAHCKCKCYNCIDSILNSYVRCERIMKSKIRIGRHHQIWLIALVPPSRVWDLAYNTNVEWKRKIQLSLPANIRVDSNSQLSPDRDVENCGQFWNRNDKHGIGWLVVDCLQRMLVDFSICFCKRWMMSFHTRTKS